MKTITKKMNKGKNMKEQTQNPGCSDKMTFLK